MTERNLSNVVRQLQRAEADLRYAQDIADELLLNHIVASRLLSLRQEVADYRVELDQKYRSSHYAR